MKATYFSAAALAALASAAPTKRYEAAKGPTDGMHPDFISLQLPQQFHITIKEY
jgi:hypothetical protein